MWGMLISHWIWECDLQGITEAAKDGILQTRDFIAWGNFRPWPEPANKERKNIMNSKHLHIENVEIRQDGSMLIYFQEDAHTYLTTEDMKSLISCYATLLNDNLISLDEEE